MIFAQKHQPYVIFLTKQKMIWGGESLKEVIPVEFSTGLIQDLEITNIRTLGNQLDSTLSQHNLHPHEVIFVLSEDFYFTKDFANDAEEEIKQFTALIPFDQVVSKRFQAGTGQRLVAISEDLLQPLVEVFQQHGFEIIAVAPSLLLGDQFKTEEQFTPELVNTLLKSLETILLYSLYTPPKLPETMTSIRNAEGKIFTPRLILMSIFFAVLIGVLLIVLYMNGYIGGKATPKPQVNTPSQPIEVPAIDLTPTSAILQIDEESSASATPSAATVTRATIQTTTSIQLLNASGAESQTDVLKAALVELGFSQITTGNATAAGQNTLVRYKPTVSQATIQAITQRLEEEGIDVSAQENAELINFDVSITIGR